MDAGTSISSPLWVELQRHIEEESVDFLLDCELAEIGGPRHLGGSKDDGLLSVQVAVETKDLAYGLRGPQWHEGLGNDYLRCVSTRVARAARKLRAHLGLLLEGETWRRCEWRRLGHQRHPE